MINLNHNLNVLANEIEIFMKLLKDHRNYRYKGINAMLTDLTTLINLMGKYARIHDTLMQVKY